MAKWILAAIVSSAFLLRVVGLVNHPAGFTPDEASFGYDAYSLLETGKDQWGVNWPLTFKSFGDYKLPLYTYLAIPSVAIFGLNEFAVRLPNAVVGTLAVIATYFLVLQTFKNRRAALLASFLLTISPWHIPLSRGAFEANLTTFLLPAGVLFLFKGFRSPHWLPLAAAFFGLNLFSYHSARLLTLPLVAAILILHRKQIKISKAFVISAIVLVLFSVLALWSVLDGGGGRAATSGIFNPTSGWTAVADERFAAVNSGQPDLLARMFNNKLLYFTETFLGNYLSYFSPQFLFTQGPAEATYGMIPGMGVIFLFELAFLVGLRYAFFKDDNKKQYYWLAVWIFLAPIAAALAKGPGYAANRAAFMMPGIQILSALGGVYLFDQLKKRYLFKLIASLFAGIIAISFIFFLNQYFVTQRALFAKDMVYGTKQVMEKIGDQQAVITKNISEGHIYAAFYQKINPVDYQQESKNWDFEDQGYQWVDQLPEYRLGNLIFSDNVNLSNKLHVTTPVDIPSGRSDVKHTIYYPSGKEAYQIRYVY